jgi:AraC-like DNA-binding protein
VGYESVLMHNHSFVEIVYIESGEGTQKIGNKALKLKKGDVFMIADDSAHSIRPECEENEFSIINIIFEPQLIDVDYTKFCPCVVVNYAEDSEIVENIYRCLAEYETKSGSFELSIKGLIHLILATHLESLEKLTRRKIQKSGGRADYVSETTKFIHGHYKEKLDLESIAAYVGITSRYLQKLFREKRNTSVIEYLLRYRVEQACKLLVETDAPVQKISLEIGFSDIKNFYYRFKKIFGVTPNEYRKIHRGEKEVTSIGTNGTSTTE